MRERPSKTKGKTPKEGEGTVTAAHLLPVKHAQYPAHALLKVDDARILATPAQLLKLSDDDPRFGRLRERGLYAEWDPTNFIDRSIRYSYIIKVPVEVNGGTFFVRSATRCTLLGRQLLPYDGGRALLKKGGRARRRNGRTVVWTAASASWRRDARCLV